jgi:hypothetical protein
LLRGDAAGPHRGGERFAVTQCLFGINIGELGDPLAENGPAAQVARDRRGLAGQVVLPRGHAVVRVSMGFWPRQIPVATPAANAEIVRKIGVRVALPRGLVRLLAVVVGVTTANVYYAQPLLHTIAASLGTSQSAAGLIVTATQLGILLSRTFAGLVATGVGCARDQPGGHLRPGRLRAVPDHHDLHDDLLRGRRAVTNVRHRDPRPP